MGKLFNLKEWLTVADAARHLSIVFGEDVTEADVLRLGLDERLRLSIYFVNQAKARCGKVVGYEDTEWKEIPDITAMSHGFQKIHERMQENKPIEERGETLRIMKSLEIGGGRYFNLDGKEIHIYGVWDLVMAGQGQMDVEQKYQTLIGGPDVTDQACYGAFIEGPEGQTCELMDVDNKMLFCLPGGGLPESGMVVVRTEALRKFEQSINGVQAPTERAHLSDKLARMNQAAAKFWGNADRSDRGTHPENATVTAWLVQQGFSQTLADKAATIIRPEWAPTGRKPEE